MAVTINDIRAIAATLPRSYEAVVRGQARWRVGRLVYAALSHYDTIMGFGFPREERAALVSSEPDKFVMPRPSDMRHHWVCVRLDAIDIEELGDCSSRRGACACRRGWRPPTTSATAVSDELRLLDSQQCRVRGDAVLAHTHGSAPAPDGRNTGRAGVRGGT